MIEVSEKTLSEISQSKENAIVCQAMDDWKHLRELKNSKAFAWFQNLVESEIRALEVKMMNPRIVADSEMARERLRVLEWRRFLSFLNRKEREVKGILQQNRREEILT